jgi:hypothetical protein
VDAIPVKLRVTLNKGAETMGLVLLYSFAVIGVFIFLAIVFGAPENDASALFLIVLSFVAPIAGFLWYGFASAKKTVERKDKLSNRLQNLLYEIEFTPKYTEYSDGGGSVISIDEGRNKLLIADIDTFEEVTGSEIIGADVIQNGRPLLGSQAETTITSAALGGLLFGGAGAIVGAVAGQNMKTSDGVYLSIAVDSLERPNIAFQFLAHNPDENNEASMERAQAARTWAERVSIMVRRETRGNANRNIETA